MFGDLVHIQGTLLIASESGSDKLQATLLFTYAETVEELYMLWW